MGAGVAGLTCAIALRDEGLRIVLVEKASVPCGRALSCDDPVTGDRVDLGPHVLTSEYPNLLSVLDTLGTAGQVVWHEDELITLVGRTGALPIRLSPLPAPLHLLPSMSKARDVSIRDQLSNVRALWLAMRVREPDLMRLDRLPATEMLARLGVTERFRDWFWRSAALSLLNVPLEECSGGALMRIFAQLVGHDRYCFGFAGGALDELFWPAAKPILDASRCKIRFDCAVRSLAIADGRCTGAVLEDGSSIEARYCVSGLPPDALMQILPQFRQLEAFRKSPYISVYHWLDRKVTSHRFWTQVWNPSNLNCDFYDLSNIRRGWDERSSVIASNIIHSVGLEDLSDDEISRRTLEETARFAPAARDARVVHRRVHRISMAIPAPHPGTESIRPRTETELPGLLIAGDWSCTALPACMESAARSGFLAAESILSREGRPARLARMPAPMQGIAGLVHRMAPA
jgi:uncharacterized protein with NAD-binding domain and iron-sulfur cluster